MTAPEASPTEPRAFGEQLKRLREATGISLEDITSETKISRRILEALESGKFQFLPEQVFSRNFVRQYAEVIGFDAERALRWFDAAWESFRVNSGSFPALVVDERPPSSWTPSWRLWLPLGMAVVILAAVTITVWRDRARGEAQVQVVSSSVEAAVPSLVPTIPPSPTIQPSPTPASAVQPGGEDAVVKVKVSVSEGRECWVRWRDREGRTGQMLLRQGESWEDGLPGPALLTIGNAGSAKLSVNGAAYESLGRSGQVVHLEVSGAGIRRLPYRGADD